MRDCRSCAYFGSKETIPDNIKNKEDRFVAVMWCRYHYPIPYVHRSFDIDKCLNYIKGNYRLIRIKELERKFS